MRFVPYEHLDDSPNIIVDGAAGRGTVLTLSHWPKSGTPAHLKRDTSAEIVYAYLDSPPSHVAADVASNNHFDEDGLVGIFALVDRVAAEKHRELLLDAASAGDFGVYRRREAARIAFTISAFADSEISPLPAEIFRRPYPAMAAEVYARLLKLMPDLIENIEAYREHWSAEDEKLSASEELIDKGLVTMEERPALDLTVVRLPEDLAAQTVHRFTQKRLATCHPFALHSRTLSSRLLLLQGRHVEFLYRYESWVQMASRHPLPRIDLKDLARELNQEETSGGRWVFDGVERITPRLYLEDSAASSIAAAVIEKKVEQHLATGAPAWDPYD